jgi:hypothetical protein
MTASRAPATSVVLNSSSAHGALNFGTDPSDLWLQQNGNDLQIFQLGSSNNASGVNNSVTVSNYFTDPRSPVVGSFVTGDGSQLNTQVEQLVTAMASYSAGNPGFDPTTATMMPNDRALQAAVLAAWHH